MKTVLLISALVFSFSAFATDFNVKLENLSCQVSSNGSVTKTYKVGAASFTEKKTVTISGLDALVKKAVDVSSQEPANTEDFFSYQMTHEGKTYTLQLDDSKEILTLIRLLSTICLN